MKHILDNIHSPDDLQKLSLDELNVLCGEIRSQIIKTVSTNGGHLSSNLGAVELTVALRRVFPSIDDKIVWDVGHQSYTHKILTGRQDRPGNHTQKRRPVWLSESGGEPLRCL